MTSVSIDSFPPQEDAAASQQSSSDFIAELQEMFAPYQAAYDESVRTVELSRTTVYQLAIKLSFEIFERLALVKSGSIFAKRLIESLWSLTTTRVYNDDDDDDDAFDPDVNVISVLYNFLTICGDYHDAPFAASTFGLTIQRKKSNKFDPNYDISFVKCTVPLSEAKFVDIFRAFRSIVARVINNSTGSYDVPERAYSREWGYSVQTKTGAWTRLNCTKEFEEFIMILAPVYEELEKFSPELTELFEVFNNASAAAKAHRAERDAKRDTRNNAPDPHSMREKHDHRRPRPVKAAAAAVAPVAAVAAKRVEQRPFVAAPPVASRWGIVNPITGASLAAVVPVSAPALIDEPREVAEVATDGEGEFNVVSRKQKNGDRVRNWQQGTPHVIRRESGPVKQAGDEATPRIQRRMERAHTWREKQVSQAAK